MKRYIAERYLGILVFAAICMIFTAIHANVFANWRNSKDYFKLGDVKGKQVFLDPDGKPFYSLAMVYAYGPESPSFKKELKPEDVIAELQKMKEHGFNTLNLYGDMYLDQVLSWCEENNIAYYPRTSYTSEEFPDFMDPEFRNKAKHSYDKYLEKIKNFRCVLAIDMDQRWMFRDSDWAGRNHPSIPALGRITVGYFPRWLKLQYGRVGALNKKWKKSYASFDDVLLDKDIILDNSFVKMGLVPWRDDVVEFAHWVINDFLKDLTSYMRTIDPSHLITYTTELPEVFLFPVSTRENSGIDFISPVHYNSDADFGRDWISLAKLIMQCKFQSDLNGMPAYISESGWRTKPLEQKPPLMSYASAKLGDENHLAELNIRQNTAIAAMPFMTGWAYFKWYDKWYEGDFGYIRDDGSDKPISAAGRLMNPALRINMQGEKAPEAYIYYPQYAFGSPKAGYCQLKTVVFLLEYDFVSVYEEYCARAAAVYKANPGPDMLKEKLFTDLVPLYSRSWYPFRFISGPKNDGKPVLLAGNSLEQLSEKDRKLFIHMKTVTFGETGIYNERFEKTMPWYLEAVGISEHMYQTEQLNIDLSKLFGKGGTSAQDCAANDGVFKLYRDDKGGPGYARCEGQRIDISPEAVTKLHFLAASSEGNIAAEITLFYSDGSSEKALLGPTVPPWSEEPAFGHLAMNANINGKKVFLAHIPDVPVNPMKKLAGIQLPDEPDVCVFSVFGSRYGVVRNCVVNVDYNGVKLSGVTPWMLFLKPGAKGTYKVLASFDNGSPAIVQSKDGKHIAFLYDTLTWDGTDKEISALLKKDSALLKQLIKELK